MGPQRDRNTAQDQMNAQSSPRIVADVGGTNARFALAAPGGADISDVEILKVGDYAHIGDAFRAYMGNHGLNDVRSACVALAGPIEGDHVRLTNGDWAFSVEQTRSDLVLERLALVNDFKAQAAALPYLPDDQLRLTGGTQPIEGRPKLIIGPGTGLGVGAVVPSQGGYTIIESEGGHIGLSPVSDREIAIHQKQG